MGYGPLLAGTSQLGVQELERRSWSVKANPKGRRTKTGSAPATSWKTGGGKKSSIHPFSPTSGASA